MPRFLNRILFIMLLFSTIFIFSFNSFAARRYDHIYIKYYNIPESSVFIDILVPEITDSVFYNNEKNDYDIFSTTSEIVNYKDSDGFVSLTFNYEVYYKYTDLFIDGYIFFSADYKEELSNKYRVSYNKPDSTDVYISLSNAYDYYDGIKYNSLEYFELLNSIPGDYRVELSSSLLFDSNRYVNNDTFKNEFKCFKIAFLDEEGNVLATSNKCEAKDMDERGFTYIYDGNELYVKKGKTFYDSLKHFFELVALVYSIIFITDLILFIINIVCICYIKKHPSIELGNYTLRQLITLNIASLLVLAPWFGIICNIITLTKYIKMLKNKDRYSHEIENLF